MKTTSELNKGYAMEELLRGYFSKAGYYVIRSVPFRYKGFEVTDVDLWMYGRASSVTREITIVDVKQKRTPQAIERIFWVKGLREAVKANFALVATTDKRVEVAEFGKELGVLVLDGEFIARLARGNNVERDRFTLEEFDGLIGEYSLGRLDGDWKGRVKACRALLAKGLSFDCCNEWLTHASFFVQQVAIKERHRDTALRCFYLVSSFLAIGVDYLLRELSFVEQVTREEILRDGFTYGSKGSKGMNGLVNVALALVEQHSDIGSRVVGQVRTNIHNSFSALKTNILAEFFSTKDVSKGLFHVAKELEDIAMKRDMIPISCVTVEARSLLLCLADFFDIDRGHLLNL